MATGNSTTALPALDGTLGAIEIGTLINCFLYGVTTVQVYIYYSNTQRKPDRLRVRLLVPFVWILETIQTTFMCAYIYRLSVTYYGDRSVIGDGHWTLNSSSLFDGIIGGLVQSFFAHRIYVLSKKWLLTYVIWFFSFLSVVGSVSIMILGQISYIAKFDAQYAWLVTTELSFFLFIDFANTAGLCAYLRVARTGHSRTDGMLNKLFLWTIETGIFTSLAALLMLILSLALPTTTLWIGITTFHCKLYSNSLMASLNARDSLRNAASKHGSSFGRMSTDNGQSRRHLQVSVMQTRTQVGDSDLELERSPPKDGKINSLARSESDLGDAV